MFFIAKWGGLAQELNFLCIFAGVLKECCSLSMRILNSGIGI
jgi:hypothetical protein